MGRQRQRPQQGLPSAALALVLWAVGSRVGCHSGHCLQSHPWQGQEQGQRAGVTGIPRQRCPCAACYLANSRSTGRRRMESPKAGKASSHGAQWQNRHDDQPQHWRYSEHCLSLPFVHLQSTARTTVPTVQIPNVESRGTGQRSLPQSPKRELALLGHLVLGPREAGSTQHWW